jgi:hypothetical protein
MPKIKLDTIKSVKEDFESLPKLKENFTLGAYNRHIENKSGVELEKPLISI